jgi:hypothetical protein
MTGIPAEGGIATEACYGENACGKFFHGQNSDAFKKNSWDG